MNHNQRETMKQNTKYITMKTLLSFLETLGILSHSEMIHALKTGELPQNILKRLSDADKASKN